ncbi:MAG: magnesium transporter MgtE N-terminal domain-containing protein [Candidatus Micrarchaeia archaeon]
MFNIVYLSQLLGKRVVDATGKKIGRLADLTLAPVGDYFPEIDCLVVKGRGRQRKIKWQEVHRFTDAIYLSKTADEASLQPLKKKDALLAKLLLDKQIVDTNGLKVVRVNDVALAEVNNKFSVISFDVGFKGLLRRMGLRRVGEYLGLADALIPWSYVAPLQPQIQLIKLKKPRQDVSNLRPAEIASVLEELGHSERQQILAQLDNATAAEALRKATPELQKSVFEALEAEKAARLLGSLSPNQSADMLAVVSPEKREEILSKMEERAAKITREIMGFKSNTAGSIMTTEFISVQDNATCGEALNKIRENPELPPYSIYVVDSRNRLVGVAPIIDLIRAKPSEPIANVMLKRPKIIRVHVNTPISQAAELIAKYDLLAVPVVDSKYRLRGRVKADDIIDVIIPPAWRKRLPRISTKIQQ